MAINQGGGQKILAKTGAYLGTGAQAISQSDANNGLIAKYVDASNWRSGQGTVTKTNAADDNFAGVILNVSKANVTSSTQPPLDTRGTVPGGNTVTLATAGNVLLVFDAQVGADEVGNAVIPSATNAGQVVSSASPGTNTVIGHVIAGNDEQVDSKNVALVRLVPA